MSSTASVVVVDDDVAVCVAVERLLASAGFTVRAFASATDALEGIDPHEVGCFVLDVRMPGVDGPALHDLMQRSGADTPTVFITGYVDIPASVQAMKRGAVDFLMKSFEDHELITAVERALARRDSIEEARRAHDDVAARLDRLTPRELQVCDLVVAGLLNKQIASALGTSEKTVKVHRARVMRKLEVGSLADLVRVMESAADVRRAAARPAPHADASAADR